ncbi:MAG: hypothetical protein V1904_12500 [Bacteroidota bacterium]
MKKIFFTAILGFCTHIGSGQNTLILHIDSVCNDINKQIEYEVVLPHTISYIVNRPAIGIQRTTLDFYYNAMSCENYDYDPLTDSVDYVVHPELYKVVMKYNVAASEFVRKEYYYDNGTLIFFEAVVNSVYNDTGIDSLRAYFDGSNLQKIEKYKNSEISEATSTVNETAENAVSYAKEYLAFFKQMNALEYRQH